MLLSIVSGWYVYVVFILICVMSVAVRRIDLYCFFFQAEDGIRDLVRSRGLGDVYKRQDMVRGQVSAAVEAAGGPATDADLAALLAGRDTWTCLLYTSDAADERSSVDLGGRRIIKKKNKTK